MKKFICILLLIISMGSMYYFSSQDGTTSSAQSGKVVEIIQEVVNEAREKITLTDDRLIDIKDRVLGKLRTYSKVYLVRKAAHFGLYALIAGFMMLLIYLFSKKVIFSGVFSFIITFMYASYDEIRQLSVEGRSGSITDVLIDSSGALTAIIILAMILLTGKGLGFVFKRKS
ncbi:MAG: VanZ family protein [Terrisporobacter sp.]